MVQAERTELERLRGVAAELQSQLAASRLAEDELTAKYKELNVEFDKMKIAHKRTLDENHFLQQRHAQQQAEYATFDNKLKEYEAKIVFANDRAKVADERIQSSATP